MAPEGYFLASAEGSRRTARVQAPPIASSRGVLRSCALPRMPPAEHLPDPPPTLGTDALFVAVHAELHKIASRISRGDRNPSMHATVLVNEAYLALRGRTEERTFERQHFLRTAARVMRHLLIDHKRSRAVRQRHVESARPGLDQIVERYESRVGDLLTVADALERIGKDDPDSVRLIDLHFFAGLSLAECAEALDISLSTAQRWWQLARARLARELAP
jgi:RNA polymerase sigma factor (TIGR02999 family)